jgi:DNA polymerase-3 subunit alpha
MDSVNKDRKNTIDGQMSLFDFADEDQKESLRISLPDLDEFPREILLSFEKELMGIYVSGHPLDDFLPLLRKNVTAHASEFDTAQDEVEVATFGDDAGEGSASIKDGAEVIIGGIIMEAALKYSAKGNAYGNIILEDLSGSVKVLAFAKTYERVRPLLVEGNKVFIKGRVQNDGEREAILICEDVKSFDDCKREVWIQFADKAEYEASEATLADLIHAMDGNDSVVIYLKAEKAKKVMPPSWSLSATDDNIKALSGKFGADNVRVVDKKLEFAKSKKY